MWLSNIMEDDMNMEEMWKDPKFREFARQYKMSLATKPKPPGPSGALGSKSTTDPHGDQEDRGRSRTRDTRIQSMYTHSRTLSRSPPADSETAHKPTDSAKNEHHQSIESGSASDKYVKLQELSPASSRSRQGSIYTERTPSRGERSAGPKFVRHNWEHKVRERSSYKQDEGYQSRRLRSTSRDRYHHRHSRSRSPRYDEDNYRDRKYRYERSQSPRQGQYNNSRHLYGDKHPRSPRYKDNYEARRLRSTSRDRYHRRHSRSRSPRYDKDNYSDRKYRRSRSRSPRRDQPPRHVNKAESPAPITLPSPPNDWNNTGYYYQAQTSYEVGGKNGSRENKNRGGRLKVKDKKTGEEVAYSTLLEKMSREDKYFFIKKHGHPFAAVVGLPYFNPYGNVPLENKLTKIVPKTTGKLFVSSGQRLDYAEYIEGRGVMRAAVIANIPNDATIDKGKFLTWGHFGPSTQIKVYNQVYASKPYYYHFRDKTGEKNWLIDAQATEYLADSASYHKKSGSTLAPIDYLRRHESKSSKSKNFQKLYFEEPNTENPYYYPILGIDKKYAGNTPVSEASAKYMAPDLLPSSTKARDARRADKIVAEEEARAKRLLDAKKASNGKVKVEAKRRVESDDEDSDIDNEGSKLVSRPARSNAASQAVPSLSKSSANPKSVKKLTKLNNLKPENEREEDAGEVMEDTTTTKPKPKKKMNKASVASLKSKWRVPSSEEELEGELVKKTDKRNNASTPPPPSSEEEEEPKKSMLSARERARRKMRPRPEPSVESQEEAEAEPESKDNKAQQGKKDELEMEVEVDGELSKPQHPVSLSESNDPGYLNKVASGSKRGQKRTASRVEEFEEGGGKGDDFSSVGYQPSDDGMRVVKVTKMSVKVPDLRAVATRTRHKTA
ncbi:unnamed protein product [Rhizoctonia solani]|uniref:Uncharacterized protein n=1 Tax=Rhizoctonia solani TaxID=456999 RepID=A0A8H3BTJ7_9AGAM|nr:unnamed protein product [Rhizoctonia solani]